MAQVLRALASGEDTRPWEARPMRKSLGAQASWGVRFQSTSGAESFARDLAAGAQGHVTNAPLSHVTSITV